MDVFAHRQLSGEKCMGSVSEQAESRSIYLPICIRYTYTYAYALWCSLFVNEALTGILRWIKVSSIVLLVHVHCNSSSVHIMYDMLADQRLRAMLLLHIIITHGYSVYIHMNMCRSYQILLFNVQVHVHAKHATCT